MMYSLGTAVKLLIYLSEMHMSDGLASRNSNVLDLFCCSAEMYVL